MNTRIVRKSPKKVIKKSVRKSPKKVTKKSPKKIYNKNHMKCSGKKCVKNVSEPSEIDPTLIIIKSLNNYIKVLESVIDSGNKLNANCKNKQLSGITKKYCDNLKKKYREFASDLDIENLKKFKNPKINSLLVDINRIYTQKL